MKQLLLPALASVSLLMAACSTTNQLAQQGNNDDVYYSEAKAKEVDYARQPERTYRTDEQLYGGEDHGDNVDYDFDYGYASRLNRFQYASPWRTYYDNWYTYSYDPWYSYRYDPWYYGTGLSLSFGWGSPYFGGYSSPWGIYGYGSPYYSNYWGPVSYYGYGGYPGWGYGGYPGWGYGGGVVVNRRNNESRPSTGTGNPYYGSRDRYSRPGTSTSTNGTSNRPERMPRNTSVPAGRDNTGQVSSERRSRPERPARTERPERTERPTERSYPQSTPRTSSGGGYSPSSGSSGGGSAPSRPDRPSRGR